MTKPTHTYTDKNNLSSKLGTAQPQLVYLVVTNQKLIQHALELTDLEDFSIDERIERVVRGTLEKFNFGFQLDAASDNLAKRIDILADDFTATEMMYSELEEKVDKLRKELYKDHEPVIKELSPLDIIEENVEENSNTVVPPSGEFSRPTLSPGDGVFVKCREEECWVNCVVESVVNLLNESIFTVAMPDSNKKEARGQELAYNTAHTAQLPVGTRCVGLYQDKDEETAVYKSCVVAEPPKIMNKYRYLVFYDSGCPAYVQHKDLRVVVQQSLQVWEDVDEAGREFIRKYLEEYPERPMVRLSVGQHVKVSCEGKWWMTAVEEVEASLVRVRFEKKDQRMEWLYRGSTRLGPLFAEMEARKARVEKQEVARVGKVPDKSIEDSGVEESMDMKADSNESSPTRVRMVAKKSTGGRKVERKSSEECETEGTVFQVSRSVVSREIFTAHTCTPVCVARYQYEEEKHRGSNPLLIPLLLGWDRQVTMHSQGGRRKVFYLAPCGRRLARIEDVHKYLNLTDLKLEIDFFNFDWWLHVLNEWRASRTVCTIKDISYGKEAVAVPCVNSIDRTYPEYVEYSTVRIPQQQVHINTEEEFLTGCHCQDDCVDRDKCSCWQLTIQSTKCDWENKVDPSVGYEYRRLKEVVLTGIYECNKLCECSKTCLNRVAQNPLRLKLQVFKTAKRGWGIRTLHDIPGGTYICNYVGNLFSTQEGNIYGKNFGDEYFADLDMIEIVESRKGGYESDVSDEGFTDGEMSKLDRDKGVVNGVVVARKQSFKKGKNMKKKGALVPSDETAEKQKERAKFISTRKLFGAEEESYIMDAKVIGNIGRYLNHSCHPNVFVQNVFVDTHDLR